jgi:hypothetical protein
LIEVVLNFLEPLVRLAGPLMQMARTEGDLRTGPITIAREWIANIAALAHFREGKIENCELHRGWPKKPVRSSVRSLFKLLAAGLRTAITRKPPAAPNALNPLQP